MRIGRTVEDGSADAINALFGEVFATLGLGEPQAIAGASELHWAHAQIASNLRRIADSLKVEEAPALDR